MKHAIFIDLDDTLIHTQRLYEEAYAKMTVYAASLGVNPIEARAFCKAHSQKLVKTPRLDGSGKMYGFSKYRFPQAFEDTLRHFKPDATAEEVTQIRAIGEQVFAAQAEVKEGVVEALSELAKHMDIYLFTKGDMEVQSKRIADLGPEILDKIADWIIVEDKNESVLRDYAARMGILPADAIFLGDSLSSDILPATQAGMQAVWVPADNWAAQEMHKTHADGLKEALNLPEGAWQAPGILDAAHQIIARLANHAASWRQNMGNEQDAANMRLRA